MHNFSSIFCNTKRTLKSKELFTNEDSLNTKEPYITKAYKYKEGTYGAKKYGKSYFTKIYFHKKRLVNLKETITAEKAHSSE